MKIYRNITELIGRTPLVELEQFNKKFQLKGKLLAKLEYFNPGGSVKDRTAYGMIRDAELCGKLTQGSVIIEPTSGNTGIGLAVVAASKGYHLIITMPETMSVERRKVLQAYGAELILTDGKKGMKGAIEKAQEIAKLTPNSFIPGQFENSSNPDIHRLTTGPEIWEDTEGTIDIFVAGVGTGGTITGIGEFLKKKNPKVKIVAVEPEDSSVISGGVSGPHKIQGIGAGFIPKNLHSDAYDEVMQIGNEEAFFYGREIAKTEGYLVGISSGAALAAAKKLAEKEENKGKTIVALLPDTGNRYLSTELFEAGE